MATESNENSSVPYFRVSLEDDVVSLVQTLPAHFDELYALGGDPELWAQHPEHDRWKRPNFERFFNAGLANELGCYSVALRASGQLLGMTRYYGLDEADAAVRIGFTFVARPYWGTSINGRIKALMLDHAFARLDRVYFDIGRENFRSQKAVGKLGAVHCGEDGHNLVFELTKAVYQR